MDIHQIYSSWSQSRKIPTEKHVQYFTVMEKPCELEFIAMLLRDAGKRVEVTPDPATMDKIPHVWNKRMVDVFVIDVPEEKVELRVFLESVGAPPYERVVKLKTDVDELISHMSGLTLESADLLMMSKSKPRIHAVANLLDARVSTDWVQLCASRLVADEPQYEFYHLDKSKFKLLRDPTDRHVHHINSSVLDFLHELQKEHIDNRGRQLTVTWQFSYDPLPHKEPIKYAIHLPKFRAAMQQLAPSNWLEFTLFLCAIGLPIHELMKPAAILEQWKRFKLLTQNNLVNVLLRPVFPEAKTVPELVRLYGAQMCDFRCLQQYDDIRQHFFKTFYSWPTREEIESLLGRIQKNALEWSI